MRFRNSIEIKEPSDFECVADDMLTDFIDDFTERIGLTREPNEDDLYAFDGFVPQWMYTQKGMKLYYRYVERLKKLGNKIFPDEKLDIGSCQMIFP